MNNDKVQVIEIVRRFIDLMIKRETMKMNQMVDSYFTLTHITGYIQSKEEWFKEIESESMKYYSYQEVDINVSTEENRATIIKKTLLDARIWGSRNTWRLQQKMQLEKRNGNWVILNSIASTF